MIRPGITRQSFLRAGALSFLGATHLDFLRLAGSQAFAATSAPKAKACILLWLEGGISHLDSWDVKANSGFRPIATNRHGVQVSEIFPGVAKHMDKLSIIRSMRTQERNHPQGTIRDAVRPPAQSCAEISQCRLHHFEGVGIAREHAAVCGGAHADRRRLLQL